MDELRVVACRLHRALGGAAPEPNATNHGLAALAPGNPSISYKAANAVTRSDDDQQLHRPVVTLAYHTWTTGVGRDHGLHQILHCGGALVLGQPLDEFLRASCPGCRVLVKRFKIKFQT